MINSTAEFARIWEKETDELTQLDYFIFLLINEMISKLDKEFFKSASSKSDFHLNSTHISELSVQVADSLQFFYTQMCFGSGCSLGCPNNLNKPFSKNEEEARIHIINSEFGGNSEACSKREDCLTHDLNDYVISDTISDYYSHYLNCEIAEDDPFLEKLSVFIVEIIIRFTQERGPELLKEPFGRAQVLSA